MTNDVLNDSVKIIVNELKNPEILKFFSTEENLLLEKETKEIRYEKGQEIIHEGFRPSGIYAITSGTAKLYKRGFNGKEQILRFAKKGDIIGYRSLLCDEPFGASASALDILSAIYIPEPVFHKLLEESSKVAFNILKKISIDLGDAGRTITLLAQKTVRERLAEILVLLEDKLGTDNDGYIKIALTREEMANLIGTATESAIRLISEFKADGLIEVDGRRIKIINHPKLTKLGHIIL